MKKLVLSVLVVLSGSMLFAQDATKGEKKDNAQQEKKEVKESKKDQKEDKKATKDAS